MRGPGGRHLGHQAAGQAAQRSEGPAERCRQPARAQPAPRAPGRHHGPAQQSGHRDIHH